MMDRNLGATSVTPKDQNAYGVWYQWGRKDPFPRPLDIVRSSATTVDNKELTANASRTATRAFPFTPLTGTFKVVPSNAGTAERTSPDEDEFVCVHKTVADTALSANSPLTFTLGRFSLV